VDVPVVYRETDHYSWSAIVRGAVLRGLEGSIVDVKKCRRHYGHSLSKEYDPKVHFNFDANKRHLWKDTFDDNKLQLSGFMFWEMNKVCTFRESGPSLTPGRMRKSMKQLRSSPSSHAIFLRGPQ
jgi:hypothetical protein